MIQVGKPMASPEGESVANTEDEIAELPEGRPVLTSSDFCTATPEGKPAAPLLGKLGVTPVGKHAGRLRASPRQCSQVYALRRLRASWL